MNRKIVATLAAGILLAAGLLAGRGIRGVNAQNEPARIAIDYPLDGSVFPPDMAPPTFQWRDSAPSAGSWQIEISFADGTAPLLVLSKGELMRIGAIDPRAVADTNKPPELTPEQAAAHTFKPDAATWAAIRQHAVAAAATITIRGFASGSGAPPVSSSSMKLSISTDPVGAPIFYRDVPLMPSETEKGFIKPLASSAIPLIEWRMRNVAETGSHVVMTDLHSCANCHSFAANGKTLGLDLDGPQNDKGLYTLVPVAKQMTIRNQDVISWSSFPTESGSPVRVGFMSQVSPDGRYVVTTIRPPGSKSSSFYYVANFKDYRFLQVFYPTRGILAWYDRETKKFQPLPGADDPRFVQASAVWSPDGKYLVLARAEARDPYRADGKLAAYANDPTEVAIQYGLYRIPFNHGLGGKRVAQVVVRLGVLGIDGDSILELLDGFGQAVFFQQRAAQIVARLGIARILVQRLAVMIDGFIGTARAGQRDGQIIVRLRVMGLDQDSLLELGDGVRGFACAGQRLAVVVAGAGVLRAHCDGFGPLGQRGGELALLGQLRGHIVLLVKIHRRRGDVFDAAGVHVDELRNVHRAIGGGGVLNQDGGRVVALGVDMGEEHLRVGRAALGGKDQPASVGREAVPGVHQRRVAGHAPGLAARGRNDVELAVGTHQLAVVSLHKDHPLAVRRYLGKAVAHAVL